MHSIGLDVSKATIAVYLPINGQFLEIENNPKALRSLYAKLKKQYKKESENLVFVYEATGTYSSELTRFCANKGILTFMLTPSQSRNFAKAMRTRNKTDEIDAKLLSQAISLARDEEIRIPICNPTIEAIQEFVGYYRLLGKQRVELINHLEALTHKGEYLSFTAKELAKQIKALKQREQEVMEKIRALIHSDPKLSNHFANLKSIDGIGDLSGVILLHLFLKYPHANRKQIISLAGLDPIIRTSGSSISGKPRISKAGSTLYRGILFMSVLSSIRHNEAMKAFYDRLKANGKHSTAAQIAIMRKLILIAHSLYKNNQTYDPKRYQSFLNTGDEAVA